MNHRLILNCVSVESIPARAYQHELSLFRETVSCFFISNEKKKKVPLNAIKALDKTTHEALEETTGRLNVVTSGRSASSRRLIRDCEPLGISRRRNQRRRGAGRFISGSRYAVAACVPVTSGRPLISRDSAPDRFTSSRCRSFADGTLAHLLSEKQSSVTVSLCLTFRVIISLASS